MAHFDLPCKELNEKLPSKANLCDDIGATRISTNRFTPPYRVLIRLKQADLESASFMEIPLCGTATPDNSSMKEATSNT
jgi:hypothetical protein